MSNSPAPVPSKTALRALRGLIFGTTCTLAVLTEDRRRRISMARTAISNGEKLKAAKGYHAGGAALAIAMEEEVAYLDQTPLSWQRKDAPRRPADKELMSWTRPKGDTRQAERVNLVAPASTIVVDYAPPTSADIATESRDMERTAPARRKMLPLPEQFVQPLVVTGPPQLQPQAQEEVESRNMDLSAARPEMTDLLGSMAVLSVEETIENLETAVSTFQKALGSKSNLGEFREKLGAVSLQLSRGAQAAGRMDLAADVLGQSLRAGLADRSNYDLYNPYTIIKSLLSGMTPTSHPTSGERARLEQAVRLYWPQFSDLRNAANALELIDLGKHMFEMSLASRDKPLYNSLAREAFPAFYNGVWDPYLHILQRLQAARMHKLVVRQFLHRHMETNAKTSFDDDIGNMVVRSVAFSQGWKADEVLIALFSMPNLNPHTKSKRRLRTSWVAELLHLQWQKTQNFRDTRELFETCIEPKIASVAHPEGVLRVMVQISLEAGNAAESAEILRLTNQLSRWNPLAETDIRLLGQVAKAQARNGDWDGVRNTFLKMRTREGAISRNRSQEFVPVFKAFLQSHTIGETEDFLKYYVSELKGPLCPEMVPLLANEYGAMKDLNAFISWLQFCVKAGFVVTANFSNAILHNAGRHWNFTFSELRSLYRRLHRMNPDYVDDVTRNIMAQAATRQAKGSRVVRSRLYSVELGNGHRPENFSEHGVNLTIKRAIISRNLGKAVETYKQATYQRGMRHSEKCLGLAVYASLNHHSGNADEAIELIAAARQQGLETTLADTAILVDTITRIAKTTHRSNLYRELQAVLGRLAEAGCPISSHALNVAAHRVLSAGDPSSAIIYALAAADAAGKRPGFDKRNFSTLVISYGRLAEPKGLEGVIRNASMTPDFDAKMGYKALKSARGYLRRMPMDKRVNQAAWAVDQGLKAMKKARAQGRDDKVHLQTAVLGIMRQAALDAGCKVVDEDVPLRLENQEGKLPEWLDSATVVEESFEEQAEEFVDEPEFAYAGADSWTSLEQGHAQEPELAPLKSRDSWVLLEQNCRLEAEQKRPQAAAVSSF